jgi:hypothetical protein
LAVANDQLVQVETNMTVEQFLLLCQDRNNEIGSYQACTVCTLIALNRHAEALQLAQKERSLGHSGGHRVGDQDFHELAEKWITASITGPH